MVAREALCAIVAVAAGSVVAAVDTDAAAALSAQLVEFRIEAALSRMAVALASCFGGCQLAVGVSVAAFALLRFSAAAANQKERKNGLSKLIFQFRLCARSYVRLFA